MRRINSKILFLLVSMIVSISASAHAIWIESNAKGAIGKAHTANIYFGEFSDPERTPVAKWFSNIASLEAYLILPNGERSKLDLVATGDHYTATFKPSANGIYMIAVSHTVGEVYSDAKIEYYATAAIAVGLPVASSSKAVTQLGVITSAQETTKGTTVKVDVLNGKDQLPDAKVVIATEEGWSKTINSNEQGLVSFIPRIAGKYMVEAIRNDKTPGTHNNKPYKTITHVVTHCINIK